MLHTHKHPFGAYITREGINRAELARRLGVHPATVTRLFAPGRRPDPEVAARIRDLLGLGTLDEVYLAFAGVDHSASPCAVEAAVAPVDPAGPSAGDAVQEG